MGARPTKVRVPESQGRKETQRFEARKKKTRSVKDDGKNRKLV